MYQLVLTVSIIVCRIISANQSYPSMTAYLTTFSLSGVVETVQIELAVTAKSTKS